MIARLMASDNGKQANRVMVAVLQVTTNDFLLACVVWFLRRTYGKPHNVSFFSSPHFFHQTKPCKPRWRRSGADQTGEKRRGEDRGEAELSGAERRGVEQSRAEQSRAEQRGDGRGGEDRR
jgi:hypothetical protein